MSVKPNVLLQKEQYLHFRLQKEGHLLPRGGATVCYMPQGDKAKVGLSLCSWKDGFCRRKGRDISRGRACSPNRVLSPSKLLTFDELTQLGYEMVNRSWQDIGKPADLRDAEIVLST